MVDNPRSSSSVNKNQTSFSSRAGLDAWLITGEEISPLFPLAALRQLWVRGCPSPYHLPSGGASPAAGQLPAIKAGILEGSNPHNRVSWAVLHS